jgi:L-ascorbate metabolism protein UlaG (beta-lactamase superfamily)
MRIQITIALVLIIGVPVVPAEAQTASGSTTTSRRAEIHLTYLGNAGWEITDGTTYVLVDPFVTEFRANRNAKPGQADPGPPSPQDKCIPDSEGIDAKIHRVNYILITHGHGDHALDAPYIARKTGAVIIGNETVANLARAYDVPDEQLIVVRGGEDYDFGAFSLKVIPSIHSALDHKHYFTNSPWAGNAPRGLKAPLKCGDFVEGSSVAYLLRLAGHQVLIMGSMNYIEREMEGLRPDIALVGANSQRGEIYDYAGRLMRALGQPALVMPTHWDRYGWAPAQQKAQADAQQFAEEIRAASPNTRVMIPKHFEAIAVP